MIELPEAKTLSGQITQALTGREIVRVEANASPHGFAWFHGLPEAYPTLLEDTVITGAESWAGLVQINTDGAMIVFNDGAVPRLWGPGAKRPKKHQLLLELDDGSALTATVQMYGGMMAYPKDYEDTNPYHVGAKEKPSPLTDAFDAAYFEELFRQSKPKLSAKAFLATEQRIPGLGNGVLQDILFLSEIHPATAIGTLDDGVVETLFQNVKQVLARMTEEGGRDTEKDLHSNPGGYRTLLSRKTVGYPCPRCGGPIVRKAYLGGNVYFCPVCQVKQ